MGIFDCFKSTSNTIDWEETERKYKECRDFADIGDKIKYLDQEVYVVGYNKTEHIYRLGPFERVGIKVEWFNSDKELQSILIRHHELSLCSKIN